MAYNTYNFPISFTSWINVAVANDYENIHSGGPNPQVYSFYNLTLTQYTCSAIRVRTHEFGSGIYGRRLFLGV